MKTKIFILLVSVVALFSFTVIKSEKVAKKQASASHSAKPASGLAVEDKNQWN